MNVMKLFEAVDGYIDNLFAPSDPILDAVLKRSADAGLPAIQISAGQGKFLYLLVKITKAKRILEIGTLGGYSTIWMARALPADGRLLTLEYEPLHAKLAQSNIADAGLGNKVEVRTGAALDTLAQMKGSEESFDVIFIDADKPNYPAYLEWALRFSHPGTLILADNVIRKGAILNPDTMDDYGKGAYLSNKALSDDPRVEAVILQQVGIKGHDGLAMAIVKDKEGQ